MVKLLIYGNATGVCSSRKLEAATHRDVAVRTLCSGQHPSPFNVCAYERRLEAARSPRARNAPTAAPIVRTGCSLAATGASRTRHRRECAASTVPDTADGQQQWRSVSA